jgi:hypothetical protein
MLRACWVVHSAVGWAVTPRRCTRRLAISITNSTYRRRKVMVSMWKKSVANSPDACARRNVRQFLARSLASEPGRRRFRAYYEMHGSTAMDRVPALIPQVYLHHDPYTPRSRGNVPGPLPRQRMDFLMLLPQDQRIVIEVDGKQHYADETG